MGRDERQSSGVILEQSSAESQDEQIQAMIERFGGKEVEGRRGKGRSNGVL